MQTIKQITIVIVLMGVAAAGGRYLAPTKVVEKEVIKVVEKIVEKKVYVKDKKQLNNKVTVKLITIKPDGTKTIETRTYDTSTIEITQKSQTDTTKDTTIDHSKEKITETDREQYMLSFAAKASIDSWVPAYGIHAQRRLLGPLWLGAFGYTDKTVGVSLGVSF